MADKFDSSSLYESLISEYGVDCVLDTLDHLWRTPVMLPQKMRIDIASRHSEVEKKNFDLICQKVMDNQPTSFMQRPLHCRDSYILCPPTGTCLNGCKGASGIARKLEMYSKPVAIKFIMPNNIPATKLKTALRCKKCRTVYNYSMYGTAEGGFRFYEDKRDAVEASDVCFVDRIVFNLQWSFA